MRVLGISGEARHAAAALAVDGSLVAAVAEESVTRVSHVGYAYTSGLPFEAVRASFTRAALSPDDVDLVSIEVNGDADVNSMRVRWESRAADPSLHSLSRRPHLAVDSLTARAAQALAIIGEGHSPVVVIDLDDAGYAGIFQADAGQLTQVSTISGASTFVDAVAQVARALGCMGGSLEALRAIAGGVEPAYLQAMRGTLTCTNGALQVAGPELAAVLAAADEDAPGPLADRSPMHVKVKEVRARLAASLIWRLAEIVGDVVAGAASRQCVVATGSVFASPDIVRAVKSRVQRLRVAPVPGPFGLALGAALFGSRGVRAGLPSGLAIGPRFTEPDVKEVLDGCRLDYVYEPDWWRLRGRVSRMLSKGKLVAWFQGAMDFGPQSLGARSILCDPSNRYTRENINRYLRHRPDDAPPPLVMLASATGECLTEPVASPMCTTAGTVKEDWRWRLQAGIDAAGGCQVHTVAAGASPLAELLSVHASLTGIPALIHVDLHGIGEPTACSPRDAVRTTFSSPVDALVIERFLLMKDYWLLRSATE